MSRYEVNPDEDYQQGSTEVLKNFLNVSDPEVISEEETKSLKATYQYYTNQLNSDDPITIKLILDMHKKWLGNIYPFAGKFRSVSMSKGGFLFAAPPQIERLMTAFEQNELRMLTPCIGMSHLSVSLPRLPLPYKSTAKLTNPCLAKYLAFSWANSTQPRQSCTIMTNGRA